MKRILIKPLYIIDFLIYYILQVIKSNLIIAWDILTPTMKTNPGTIKIDVYLKSKHAILALSNIISMTPGTITIDYNKMDSELTIHVLYKQNEIALREELNKVQAKINRIAS